MDSATRRLIEAIHSARPKYVLALTGGGAHAAGLLLSVPGGSRTILEVAVPYHEQALAEYLGHRPEQFCSAATSRNLARRAYERALWLTPGEAVVGVGCTASLATDRPKHGDHRFHLAVHVSDRITTYSLTLCKGARDREAEEAVLDAVLLNALADCCGVAEKLPLALLADEAIQIESQPATGLAALLQGNESAVCVEIDGRLHSDLTRRPAVLLPGSFNPVHEGHWGLAAAAARLTGALVAFELSVTNVDKPPLAGEEVYRRLAQFTWRASVWLTKAPTFVEKAVCFPNTVFVVGADTAARIVDPRYYQDGAAANMLQALETIRERGCRFHVAGRVDSTGRFVGVDELALPAAYRDLFTGIPETVYRLDVSSTQLRSAPA